MLIPFICPGMVNTVCVNRSYLDGETIGSDRYFIFNEQMRNVFYSITVTNEDESSKNKTSFKNETKKL